MKVVFSGARRGEHVQNQEVFSFKITAISFGQTVVFVENGLLDFHGAAGIGFRRRGMFMMLVVVAMGLV